MKKITIRPISAEEFAPFGELLVTRAQASKMINAGRCERHHALATVERGGGEAIISIFRSEPVSLPYDCALLERHPELQALYAQWAGKDHLRRALNGGGKASAAQKGAA